MKILVTGSEGYIGSQLVPVLMERGHQVVGFDTGYYSDACLYNGLERPAFCIRQDIRTIREDQLQGFDAVVHLAELSNDPLGQHSPAVTYEINHLASVRLARKCKQVGIARFVYSSSCSVYGAGSEEYKTEESETAPQTAYAHCKLLVERDVSSISDESFSPTFLRNATAFGASPSMRFDLVLNNLAGLAWTRREIRMTSDGTPVRPLVHVLDICEVIACTLEAPREKVHNQIFNVGHNGANYQVKEIAAIVSNSFPGCKVMFGSSNGDRRSYRCSFDKLHSQLPEFRGRSVREGTEELHRLFESIKLTADLFEFRSFTRLKQLDYLLTTGQLDERFYWI